MTIDEITTEDLIKYFSDIKDDIINKKDIEIISYETSNGQQKEVKNFYTYDEHIKILKQLYVQLHND